MSWPPDLDSIDVPAREHITAILKARGLERHDALIGMGVAAELLRGVVTAHPGIPGAVTRLVASAITDWMDSRADLPPAA